MPSMTAASGIFVRLRSDPRIAIRRDGPPDPEGRCVLYWMQRAQRALDNPALDTAVAVGNELGKPVVVFLGLMPSFPGANLRHFEFFAEGLADLAPGLRERRVGLLLRRWSAEALPRLCAELRPALVIGDENPLREPERWRQRAAEQIRVPFWTVDADVIVPSRLLGKQQYAARTIRPRIQAQLATFLVSQGNPVARKWWRRPRGLDSVPVEKNLLAGWKIDRSVSPAPGFRGGTREALRLLEEFLQRKLARYAEDRNHPERDGTSRLSPYLHFGQIDPLTVAL